MRPPTRLWSSVHGDDCAGLGADVDVEQKASQQRVSSHSSVGTWHRKREMRTLNHVLTWRSSEAGRVEMITCEEDPRHVHLLLRGAETGSSGGS